MLQGTKSRPHGAFESNRPSMSPGIQASVVFEDQARNDEAWIRQESNQRGGAPIPLDERPDFFFVLPRIDEVTLPLEANRDENQPPAPVFPELAVHRGLHSGKERDHG